MNTDKNLPVDVILVENTGINGVHYAAGEVIKQMPAELALDLAGSGKVRLYTEAKKAKE